MNISLLNMNYLLKQIYKKNLHLKDTKKNQNHES